MATCDSDSSCGLRSAVPVILLSEDKVLLHANLCSVRQAGSATALGSLGSTKGHAGRAVRLPGSFPSSAEPSSTFHSSPEAERMRREDCQSEGRYEVCRATETTAHLSAAQLHCLGSSRGPPSRDWITIMCC
jgi:hypothetical protein